MLLSVVEENAKARAPEFTAVVPVYRFALLNVSVPMPCFVRPSPAVFSLITPVMAMFPAAALATVKELVSAIFAEIVAALALRFKMFPPSVIVVLAPPLMVVTPVSGPNVMPLVQKLGKVALSKS